VLPAVAEMLDPLHKPGRWTLWRGQQQVIPTVSVHFVIDSVRKGLDITSSNLCTLLHKSGVNRCEAFTHPSSDRGQCYLMSGSRNWMFQFILCCYSQIWMYFLIFFFLYLCHSTWC